jgi:hypothetical protein
MYRVLFSHKPLKKNRNYSDRFPETNSEVNEIVSNLEPETEINVQATDQTYYNALFLAFDHRTNKVSLLTDRFYKHGNRLTILECNDIIGIDLPVSDDSDEKSDNEDE